MKNKANLFTIIVVILLFFFAKINITQAVSDGVSLAGGECAYDEFDGVCKIMNLYFNEEKSPTKLVKFKFEPYVNMDAKSLRLLKDRNLVDTDQESVLDDFVPSDWSYRQRIGLEIGDNVKCKLKLETSGTCTPAIFSMQEVLKDQNAYSDLASRGKIINVSVPALLLMFSGIVVFSVHKTVKKKYKHHKHNKKKK